MDQIRIIIVEDGKQTAAGINKLVQFEKDMLVVGMAETGEEAIRLAGELDPHVILMDTGLPDMRGIEAARTIIGEQICVQVVLLALEPDTDMMRDAMKAGIRDVVRKPPTAEALYKAIREAHEHYLELLPKTGQLVEDTEMAPPPILGTMMAIYSGKGGVGCTTIATNLAVKLHSEEKPVVLVDANLQYGDVSLFLDLGRRHSIEDLLPFEDHADPELLLEVLNTHESGLQVLSAPHSIEEAASVTPTDVRSILQDLRSRFGWVVVDTPTAVDDLTLAIFEDADIVVNVLTPDIPAIKSSRAFLELLDTIGVSADKVIHVLNMVENRKGISSKSIEENLQSEILAEIPYDRSAILEAVNKGEPTVLSGKTKPFSRGIYNLLAKIREIDQKVAEAEPVLDA